MSIEEEEDTSLKELVTKTLQSNGVLGRIQAQLRASVFLALEEELREKSIPLVSPPTRKVLGTREGAVAASLVHDFLQCLGLDFSLSVFIPESGLPALWSSHSPEALSSSLGLSSASAGKGERDGDEKGHKTPLLIELLRERETPPSSAREQNGEASNSNSISSNNSNRRENNNHHHQQEEEKGDGGESKHPLDPPLKAPGSSLGGKGRGEEDQGQGGGGGLLFPSSLPPLNLENGQRRDGNVSGKLSTGGATTSTSTNAIKLQDFVPPDESKTDSDASLNGEDKQYEDDFSSMSEKDGHDEEEEEEDEEEEEEEVEEDIEEDLDDISADDLLNSSASGVSDITKDQSLSQASSAPAYQEDL
ncbi:centrosomal protein 43-like [Eriocheir sinensis]|uniref:centrosomal protein 43-like n=1 Tax=Eriocheir sinensis TaxID=95602 RepID=UPI0021C73BAD|nr:centrosomal protein 43-like [Eriocheir sinensis]